MTNLKCEFSVGTSALWKGLPITVMEAPSGGNLLARATDGPSDILQLPVADVQHLPVAPTVMSVATVVKVPSAQWDGCAERARVVRSLLALPGGGRSNAILEASHRLGLSTRTLFRDMRTLKATDRTSALLPRSGGRPIGARLLDKRVEAVIAEKFDSVYLARNRPPLSEVFQEIQSECRKQGLDPPCEKTVRRRADALDAYEVLHAREGAKRARYKRKPMVGHIQAEFPLSCIQIDHTLADVILVAEGQGREILWRPWLTLAIDVRTRMIVGLYVSFDAPSALSVAMCLTHALLPKEVWLQSLGIDPATWPIHGKPVLIYVDNGKDFHSDALTRGCAEMGIDLQYRPVGSPHYGGIIERLIGTMMGRCRLLPGATQRDVRARGDYDAEAHATMTLAEFTAWIANEIATQYHARSHRELEVPPLVAWQRDLANELNAPALRATWTRHEILATFLPFETRKIRRTGIEMWGIHYWAPGLTEWVGEEQSRPVHYDPRDISVVYLRGPNGTVLTATQTREGLPCCSLAEWRALRARNRRAGRDPALLALRDGGIETRRDLIDQSKKATRAARRASAREAHRQAAVQVLRNAATTRAASPPQPSQSLDVSRHSPALLVQHWSN